MKKGQEEVSFFLSTSGKSLFVRLKGISLFKTNGLCSIRGHYRLIPSRKLKRDVTTTRKIHR